MNWTQSNSFVQLSSKIERLILLDLNFFCEFDFVWWQNSIELNRMKEFDRIRLSSKTERSMWYARVSWVLNFRVCIILKSALTTMYCTSKLLWIGIINASILYEKFDIVITWGNHMIDWKCLIPKRFNYWFNFRVCIILKSALTTMYCTSKLLWIGIINASVLYEKFDIVITWGNHMIDWKCLIPKRFENNISFCQKMTYAILAMK